MVSVGQLQALGCEGGPGCTDSAADFCFHQLVKRDGLAKVFEIASTVGQDRQLPHVVDGCGFRARDRPPSQTSQIG